MATIYQAEGTWLGAALARWLQNVVGGELPPVSGLKVCVRPFQEGGSLYLNPISDVMTVAWAFVWMGLRWSGGVAIHREYADGPTMTRVTAREAVQTRRLLRRWSKRKHPEASRELRKVGARR